MEVQKMKSFKIRLAGIIVEIFHIYPEVRCLCREYFCEGDPEFAFHISEEDIQAERKCNGDAYTSGYLETLAVYRKIVEAFVDRDILLVHGSAVAVDGKAYLFTAPSGTGKSTHVRMWREHFLNRAVMVNDDKPLIRFQEGQAIICGTPWNGKHRLGSKIEVPLFGICVLKRGESNTIIRTDRKEVYKDVIRQIYHPIEDGRKRLKTMELADRLLELPLYLMHCTISEEAAEIAYEKMKGETTENEDKKGIIDTQK